jgi:methylglutaconyl-CoA hydratase
MSDTLIVTLDDRGIVYVSLNRPDVHNAFNDELIESLSHAFNKISIDPDVRAVVLAGNGKSFSAGADLNWMKKAANYTFHENIDDALHLSQMLNLVYTCPKPTIALVQGAVYGGGVGLVACCDIVLAASSTIFSLSEVRLGLTPATISPFVVSALGSKKSRRLFMTAERFTAEQALAWGLIDYMSDNKDQAQKTLDDFIDAILLGAPGAQGDAKALVHTVANHPISDELRAETARRIAERRASDEGKEGLNAFLSKRKANWVDKS